MWRVGCGVLVLLVACSRAPRASAPPSDAAPALAAANGAGGKPPTPGGGTATPVPDSPNWVQAIRRGDFRGASAALAALPESTLQEPRIRFARARVAAKLGDFQTARDNLEGIEAELPELHDEILRSRAEAELECGPYGAAAAYFAARSDVVSQERAALAELRDDQLAQALRLINAVIAAVQKQDREARGGKPLLETEARFIRAQVAAAGKHRDLEVSDLLWILTRDPLSRRALAAQETLTAKYPSVRFSEAQRLARAQIFSRAGDVGATEQELEALHVPKATVNAPVFASLLRAWARYYSKNDYAEAAALLAACAPHVGQDRPKLLFYAARALSRADRDAEAIAKYQELMRLYPNSSYTEEASYLSARLRYIDGQWQQADQAYGDYLRRFAKVRKRGRHTSRFASQAGYEQSVARLITGQSAVAADLGERALATDNPYEKARLTELRAVALSKSEPVRASEVFRQVIEQWPLSLPAWLAEARLHALGVEPTVPAPNTVPTTASQRTESDLAVALPEKAELLHEIGFDQDAEAVLAQAEESIRRKYEPRGGEALCELYGRLDSAMRRYSLARRVIKGSVLLAPPTPDTRWAWECLYPRAHRDLVEEVEKDEKLPRGLIYAVMRQESAFDSRVVSGAGAVGLMQVMPGTAKHIAAELGLDLDETSLSTPEHNIRLGGRYLHKLLDMFSGQLALVLAAYNAGPHAVSGWLEHGEELPLDLWIARIPFAETRNYVTRVLGNWIRYTALFPAPGEPQGVVELTIPPGLRANADVY